MENNFNGISAGILIVIVCYLMIKDINNGDKKIEKTLFAAKMILYAGIIIFTCPQLSDNLIISFVIILVSAFELMGNYVGYTKYK